MQRFLQTFVVGLGTLMLATWGAYQGLNQWAETPKEVKREVVVHFPKGTKLDELGTLLQTEGLVRSAFLFKAWVRLDGQYSRFQAGNYRFTEGSLSPKSLSQTLTRGEAYVPVVLQITIPEGFNLRQIAARLAANQYGTEKDLYKLLSSKQTATKLGIPAASLEGFIYPATYNYTERPDLDTLLGHMVKQFFSRLPADYLDALKTLGLSLSQAVTFASLIELETMHEDEKIKVSEVIWRRLKASEPIGIDAALIYGIKDYGGNIKWQHLRDASNRYNTRIHKGLPPSPIGSPSLSSLIAVLNPSNEGYYFYVLVPDGRSRHHFSTSLSEHNRYVKLLLAADKSKDTNKGEGQ